MIFRLAAAALATAVVLGQQQTPQFRAGVESVAIYATVFDRSNQVVRDLTREDFQVFDDGRRQELTVFQNTFQPISAVLMVDTSASMSLTLDLAREAAEQFLVRLSPGDKVRVGSFSDSVQLSDTFTDNRDWLLRWLRTDLHIGNPTRLWDGLNITLTALADLGGRRVVVLITDGEDTRSSIPARTVVERAKAEGIMVYAVQIRSRSRPGMELDILGPGRPSFTNIPTVVIPPSQILRELAEHTGGAHFMLGPNDDVNATFTEVAFELHYQYVLGFTPQRLDGKLHTIDVRPSDPQWTVRARRFYVATKPGTH